MNTRIHPTAEVSLQASIGENTSVWHQSQIREGAVIGKNCILGKGVYIDEGVCIGDQVKIQNYVSIFHGVTIEDGVFIGPHVCFTNDLHPRAVNPDGTLKAADDWILTRTLISKGASLGANSTIVCGVTIGQWAMIGAGSVVTRNVPNYALYFGNPARLHGFVCPCGNSLKEFARQDGVVLAHCTNCDTEISIPAKDWGKNL
jgi:UDP-2-acetamido-3-amino-2,3-dideoxy-glucuronate N-acetyltransferase